MVTRTVKLLVLQAYRLLGLALERWDDDAEEVKVDGVVDDDLVKQERIRDDLRRRGVNV